MVETEIEYVEVSIINKESGDVMLLGFLYVELGEKTLFIVRSQEHFYEALNCIAASGGMVEANADAIVNDCSHFPVQSPEKMEVLTDNAEAMFFIVSEDNNKDETPIIN